MSTGNAANANSSGILSYNGSGTFSALASPLTIANGGTGASSQTAYAILCGGTTSTNPIQSIASVGSAGQVLTSNGAGALPTFQDASGTTVYFLHNVSYNNTGVLADSTTYYLYNCGFVTGFTSLVGTTRWYIPKSGTITACYGSWTVSSPGSGENVTLSIYVNGSSSEAITSTMTFNASNTFSNTGLSTAVSTGDYVTFVLSTPNFSSNPSGVGLTFTCAVT